MGKRAAWLLAFAFGAVVAQIGSSQATFGSWSNTGSMSTPRWFHTASLLANGKVLVAGGIDTCCGPALASAELYNPATGTWSATGSMLAAHSYYTATVLSDGRVLVAGGRLVGYQAISSAEIYDPATGIWTATGSLNAARWSHTATLLGNGKVLVAGGYDGSQPLSSAELYDPATGIWTATGSMSVGAEGATATLLQSGDVLVAGGLNSTSPSLNAYDRAEIYDVATGIWLPTGSMGTRRRGHVATLLNNGNVLVAGGITSGYYGHVASAEVYSPITGMWTATASMANAREKPTATLLPNGKVLVAGGAQPSAFDSWSSAEFYDATAGTWSKTASMNVARQGHTATLLPDGRVLVAGGAGSGSTFASAELFSSSDVIDTGRAYVIGLTTPAFSRTLVDTGPVATDSPGAKRARLAMVPANPYLSATLLEATVTARGKSTASAYLAQATVSLVPGSPIVLKAVRAESRASCSGASGSTTIGFLQIGSMKLINFTPQRNTGFSLGGGWTLMLNEQTSIPNGIQVRGVHLASTAAGVDLVISSAESDMEGCA